MKKLLLLIVILFSVSFSFAQEEELSEKEKARREKNIQAGNPFKRFGYKPKIATLSKGKYLEFHDLDSIVTIGSYSYHVKRKAITGYTKLDTVHPESTLRPEIISRWFSPDPLSDEFPSWSPYTYTNDNPVFFTDPTGLAPMSPIYGTDGEFLGTDDQGLTGLAIVMDADNFTQSMSHDDAMSNSLGVEGFNNNDAIAKFSSHYDGLKDRPDYDGVLTKSEAFDWYRQNTGETLFIDVNKLKLNDISIQDLTDKNGNQTKDYINFFPVKKWRSKKDNIYYNYSSKFGKVYGSLAVSILNKKTGLIELGAQSNGRDYFDKFDFSNPIFKQMAKGFSTKGTDYKIKCFRCTTTIKQKNLWGLSW